MTLIAADFIAKILLILLVSRSVVTGSAHSELIIWSVDTLPRRAMFDDIYIYLFIYPSIIYCMSWFVAFDQLRQLCLLWRRHNFKANLRHTNEAQIRQKKRVYTQCFLDTLRFVESYNKALHTTV